MANNRFRHGSFVAVKDYVVINCLVLLPSKIVYSYEQFPKLKSVIIIVYE